MKTKRNRIRIWLLCLVLSTLSLQPSTAFAQPVTKVAAGDSHSLFLKSDGSLWAMGNNDSHILGLGSGQLGDGTYHNTDHPEQIVATNVTVIAGGFYHSLFLKSDGSLWGMGWEMNGQLGNGTLGSAPYFSTNRPGQIVATNVTAIAGGFYHSLFLKSDGSLWGMGNDYAGQLGDGTGFVHLSPEQIVASNVVAIAAGQTHSLFLKSDGSLWAMGSNLYGQLGNGTYNGTNLPEQIVISNVVAIAAGPSSAHSLFLKSDGSLWVMGLNAQGQLGDGTTNNVDIPEQIVGSNVTAIAAGGYHSLFLKSDGSLWAMGNNNNGQLGDGTYNKTNLPERIVASGVTAIAAGSSHSLFLKSDGSLWAMGNNSNGQLGDGTYNKTNRPERIVAGPPGYGYNQMSIQFLSGGNMCSYFGGVSGTNYALDHTFSLSPPDWVPQATNPANIFGVAEFINTADQTTNNFWRIRSVP